MGEGAYRIMAVIIGSGNVASALAPALESAGVNISQIWSRDRSHAGRLASGLRCNPEPIDDLSALRPDEDLYLVAVADDAIKEIAGSLEGFGGLWAHTSGSVSADTLSAITDTYGVFYPLQTFTRGISVDMSKVPLYIEGADQSTEKRLLGLARRISSHVSVADSVRRRRLHAAAVFACNFVNYMWSVADDILREEGDDIRVLFPLIEETMRKMETTADPASVQTGPARRNDQGVMEGHMRLLPTETAELYRTISSKIINRYHHECDQL